ncbi:VOC family protein [Acrocarpospora sp. B8E8]|uniref:VOC family protein n=1 Tax=Acrocarpospora sp. B8E8 TaxID=3153572 RepID=UPI00325C4B5D
MVDHVDHIGIAVRDADLALPFYVERLGLTVIGDELADDPGVRLVYLDGGNVMLQLVQPYREGPVASFLAERGEGLHHVCFCVDDIPATLAALPGQGGAPIFMGGRGRRACFLLAEPNGVRVELTEREPIR